MVYYMKESCRLSYMRGNEPDEGGDYIKDYKAYPTYVGMFRQLYLIVFMPQSLSRVSGSESGSCTHFQKRMSFIPRGWE